MAKFGQDIMQTPKLPMTVGDGPPWPIPEEEAVAQGFARGEGGQATLEQRLRLLEQRFGDLEAELQPVLSKQRAGQQNHAPTRSNLDLGFIEDGGHEDDAQTEQQAALRHERACSVRRGELHEVSLEKSTWDLVLFMGNLETGCLASVITGAFIALNLVVQLAFSLVLIAKFNRREGKAVGLATRWRETIGHAYLSSDNLGNSLASRVCAEDESLHISGRQLESLSTASGFAESIMGNMSVGTVISICCILSWCLSIVVEIKTNWLSVQAIWNVPRRKSTDFAVEGEQLKLQSISYRKLAVVTLMAIVRLGVALMLVYAGAVWLSATMKIVDIIVNAVALNFVLEIDELIYITIIPQQVAMRAQSLKPLALLRARSWQGLDARTAVLILGTLASVVAVSVGFVLPQGWDAKAIQDALCGGDRHFVLESHAPTGIILGFHTPISGQGPPSGAAETLMQEVASNLVGRHQYPKEHFEMKSWSDFVSARSMSLGEYMDAYGTCVDFGTNDTHLRAALRSVLGRPDVTSCGDLDRKDCSLDHPITRLACPVTCKCSTPMSGVYRLEGCPLKHCAASESYRKVKANGRTADVHADVLSSMPDWIHYWKGYSDFTREHLEAQLLLDLEPRVVQDQFLKLGCGAVDEVGKAHPFRSKSSIRDFFCSEMDSKRRPLSAFCPDTCGCSEDGSEDKYFCPRMPLDNHLRSRDHLEFIVPGPPNCSVTASALFQDTPAEYNHRSLYRFTEKASGITWEIRWETELDYGGAFLGTTALPKWTLTGYVAGSSRSWHAFGQGNATLPQATGWLLASNASNAGGPWGCPTVFAEMLPVSWKLDRSRVTCTNKVPAPASSVEECADACIDQAGADCTWFFWIFEECFLPLPGCQIAYDALNGGKMFRRLSLGTCHDFTGIYFTQSGSIAHVRQAGCSLEVVIGGNAARGTFDLLSGDATADTARRGSIFLEGGLGNGTLGPGVWDRDVYFTSAEPWKRVSFSSQNTAGDGARSCQDRGQSPVSRDLCIAFAQEVGAREPWVEYNPHYRRGCYGICLSYRGGLRLYFNEHPNGTPTSLSDEIGVCMSTEAN